MDDHRKNSVNTEGPSEGQSGQQLSPYCVPTHDVEAFDGNHGREVIPTFGEEWTSGR